MFSKKIIAVAVIVLLYCVLISAGRSADQQEEQVRKYFNEQVDSLELQLIVFERAVLNDTEAAIRDRFRQSRGTYKKIEFLVEYYYPSSAGRMNGAALLEAEASEPQEPRHPSGFQVLEEYVFEDMDQQSRLLIKNEISSVLFHVRMIRTYMETQSVDALSVFDALRLNIYRLMAKGISGFDSPVAFNSLPEAKATLEGMKEVLGFYDSPEIINVLLDNANQYIDNTNDFDKFNRAIFITAHINPILQTLHEFQLAKGVAFTNAPRAIDPQAKDFFQLDAFDRYYFAPTGTEAPTQELLALGEKLFYDPLISANGQRSCGTCHNPAKAFTDGLPLNQSIFGGKLLLRNTPTLINAALQPVQFADSRIAFLEDQVHAVVSNDAEMAGDFGEILTLLKKDKNYISMFSTAFGRQRDAWKVADIKKALAAYVRDQVRLNSKFDQYMRGDLQAMNEQEISGFNLFMGKAKCGTCHYVPLFSGAVPPLYDKMESEVLGVPRNTDTLNARIDPDSGKYHLYRMPHQLRSFKTPGLRNIALTAPYMHNGVYQSLEEVIEFYNKGGGAGLGFDLPNQTLPPDRLNLTPDEQKNLIFFLKTLTDTSSIRLP